MAVATLILPCANFFWSTFKFDRNSLPSWWHFIVLGQSIRLACIMIAGTSDELLHQARHPEEYTNEHTRPTSIAIKECPTRNFKVGNDIYTFAFILCSKKRILRKNGMFEEAVPNAF